MKDPQQVMRNEILSKFPGLAKSTAPRAAIKLFCIECMGGSLRDARACESRGCFLWPLWRDRVRSAAPRVLSTLPGARQEISDLDVDSGRYR